MSTFKMALTFSVLLFPKYSANYDYKFSEEVKTESGKVNWGEVKDNMSDDRKKQIKNFLDRISMIESSGGTNFDHKQVDGGIHDGHRAAGRYGLMPNTVSEVETRMRRQGIENRGLSSMEPGRVKQELEANPEYEQQLAEYLANHVIDRQQGDEEKAAYSWFQGHNMTPERIKESNYKEHDYVKKYNKYKNIRNLIGDKDK